ncbi:MAG: hypothetical protein JWO22_3847 [Frankiales bacterium]|nr:hypothetical protein [Frankiales bacterium]
MNDFSFEGTRAAQRLRWAEADPVERLEAAETLLELALVSGALQRIRDERQRAVDAMFDVT